MHVFVARRCLVQLWLWLRRAGSHGIVHRGAAERHAPAQASLTTQSDDNGVLCTVTSHAFVAKHSCATVCRAPRAASIHLEYRWVAECRTICKQWSCRDCVTLAKTLAWPCLHLLRSRLTVSIPHLAQNKHTTTNNTEICCDCIATGK